MCRDAFKNSNLFQSICQLPSALWLNPILHLQPRKQSLNKSETMSLNSAESITWLYRKWKEASRTEQMLDKMIML